MKRYIVPALAATAVLGLALPAQAGVGGFFRDVTEEPIVESAPTKTTGVYGYELLDPTKPAGTRNSGPQHRIMVAPGWVDPDSIDLTGWPCNTGVQIDQTWLSLDAYPVTLPGAYGLPKGSLHKGFHRTTAPCEEPPVEEPPVVPETPPVVTPVDNPPIATPVQGSTSNPVTPNSPKDLTRLSAEQAAENKAYAAAHGIQEDQILREMG